MSVSKEVNKNRKSGLGQSIINDYREKNNQQRLRNNERKKKERENM